MGRIVLAILVIPLLCVATSADDSSPAAPASPQGVKARQKHDAAIKEAKDAYHKAVIVADQQYIAQLDTALKQAMANQNIDLARAIDDKKKAAVALLKKDQSLEAVTDSSLIAFYPLNGTADDASGHQANGTLQNGLSFVDGPFGKGIHLIGQGQFGAGGQYVALPSTEFSAMPEFTISIAANIEGNTSLPDGEGLIAFGPADSGFGVVDIGYGGPRNTAHLDFRAGAASVTPPMTEDDWKQWHRYSMVYSNGFLTAYVDDRVVGKANGTMQSSAGNAGMGIHWWSAGVSTRFVGSIADVRIYNRALNADDIAQLAQPGNDNIIVNQPASGQAAQPPKRPASIVGQWRGFPTVQMTFAADGAFTEDLGTTAGPVTVHGNWSINETNLSIDTTDNPPVHIRMQVVQLDYDKLILQNQGVTATYQRVGR